MSRVYLVLLILFVCPQLGKAHEFRVWEDVNGNQFEGRFYREMFDKLIIESEDGERQTFEVENLSELDQKYIRVMVPPRIEVEVRTKSSELPKRPQELVSNENEYSHQVTAVITKKSRRPFTSRLKVEIFLVAKEVEGSNHILLNRTEGTVLLPLTAKGTQVELKSNKARTMIFEDIISAGLKGEDYKGHLIVISSMQDDVVLIESNLPSWMEQPEIIESLRELSIRGAPSVRSRHFDKTGKKVPPPRPLHSNPTTP